MTLEGGFGRDFLKGVGGIAVAYYAQWKLSGDSTAGLGPELTLPLATKKTLFGFFTFRCEWEVEAHTTTQGRGKNVMVVFPLKPIEISKTGGPNQ